MQPTSRQLIEGIVAAIDEVILPAVTEKQAASSLRAARTLLEHLAVRSEVEYAELVEDNDDVQAVLGRLGRAAEDVLQPHAASRAPPASLAALQARNDALQAAVEDALRTLPPTGREDAAQAEMRRELRAYLARRRERERSMIFPAFLGTPF